MAMPLGIQAVIAGDAACIVVLLVSVLISI